MKRKIIGSFGIVTTLSTSTMANKKQNKLKKPPPSLSPPLIEEVLRFIEYHPAERFTKNLRKMLLEFLQHDSAIEANYLNDLLYDLEGLFGVLDAILDNQKGKSFDN